MQAAIHSDGRLTFRGELLPAALGRAGVRQAKEEGDGATPAGLLPLRRVLYRADRLSPPECAVPVEPIAPDDGWCDDATHPDYNRMIKLPHQARHEPLWRRDDLYNIVGVLGWNDAPVQKGRGSAIFLHIAQPDYAPTEGCIALSLPDVRRVLAAGVAEFRVFPP